MLTHSELNVMGLIGILLLIGIVKKNAIMMIDFALETERKGKSPAESIYEACIRRFRPIMMTTMAALLGGLPLALGHRHRIGTEASAGHHDSRRTDHEPGAHAVHHAGCLSISGSLPPDAGKQTAHRSEPARATFPAAQRRRLIVQSLSHPQRTVILSGANRFACESVCGVEGPLLRSRTHLSKRRVSPRNWHPTGHRQPPADARSFDCVNHSEAHSSTPLGMTS